MVRPILALILILARPAAASHKGEPHRVLVLHSFRNSLPINEDWYNALVRGFSSAPDLLVEIDTEAPDLTHFKDTDHIGDQLDFYRKNYKDRAPHLIVPTYTPALRFLLVHGEDLFPRVPIVFVGAESRFVAAQKLTPQISITSRLDIAGTLELALHVHHRRSFGNSGGRRVPGGEYGDAHSPGGGAGGSARRRQGRKPRNIPRT